MKNIFYIIAFFGALLVAGCKSNNTTQVVYTGDVVPGTIVGQVTLYDSLAAQNGNYTIVANDPSGVQVSIEGTSLTSVTDKGGRYSLSNVPPGAYWIIFKKDGFATYHEGVVDFPGNGTDRYDGDLSRLSFITPELILRPFDSSGTAIFTFKVLDSLQTNQQVNGYVFFAKSDAISPSDPNSYVFSYSVAYRNNGPTGLNNVTLTKTYLVNQGFASGDKIYCVAYTGKRSAGVSYLDLNTFKRIYTGFSPYTSGVKSFLLP